jgi:hypothetical protein
LKNFDEIRRIVPPSLIIFDVDSESLVSAAFRLKHDLGKAVRWNAPASRESDPEALRRRLEWDLAGTRTGAGGDASAVAVFDAWQIGDGSIFRGLARYEQRLNHVREAVDVVRMLLPRLSELGWDDLVSLDDVSLRLQEETQNLWRDVVSTVASIR